MTGPISIRTRLALWYSALLGAILLLCAIGVTAFFLKGLREEFDRNLGENYERGVRHLELQDDGTLGLRKPERTLQKPNRDFADEMPIEVRGSDGKLLYQSRAWEKAGLGSLATSVSTRTGNVVDGVTASDGHRFRIMSGHSLVGAKGVLVRVGMSEERVWNEVRELGTIFLLLFPFAILLSAGGGYWMATKALRPVEKSFEELERFTSDASHELRTPLQALRSMGEVALNTPHESEYYREVISSMLEETDRMAKLTQSLLTLSRADSGHVKLNYSPVKLDELVAETVHLLEVLADEKGQKLSLAVEGRCEISADPIFLRQAVLNLIDNAIKYSPRNGEIKTRIYLNVRQHTVFEVSDQGPGIAVDHREKIFDRFYRIEKSRTRELGGTGLGLSITKWAVDAHGGKIELESALGQGSTFRIVLPPRS